MKYLKMLRRYAAALSEWARTWFMPWRWPARLKCHGSVACCQHIDRPNDNNPSKRIA
jgi:hypothetical protein